MREAITLEMDGLRLQGTYHRPGDPEAGDAANGTARPWGLLFLNPGYLPRSSRGDLAAHVADDFAARGFPSFRFDMPGLGDSEGDLPQEVLGFFQRVTSAYYARYLVGVAKALRSRYNLNGLIPVGHCGGSVTSLFACEQAQKEAEFVGLILLEPAFILYRAPAEAKASLSPWRRAVVSLRDWGEQRKRRLRAWLISKPVGERALEGLAHFKSQIVRWRGVVPGETNQPLLEAWQRLAARGLPMLVFTARPAKPAPNQFDYVRYLLARHGGAITHVDVEGTNHSFVEGGGKEAVTGHSLDWLLANFA